MSNSEASSNLCLYSESEVAQLCPTLCDPMDSSLHQAPPIHGIFKARVLEWQGKSTGVARQEYWSGLPFPSPGSSYKGTNPICVSSTLMIYSPSKGPTS